METKERKEYKTSLGTFSINSKGNCFIVCDFSKHPYQYLEDAIIFEENGFKGMRRYGEVLCPAVFDSIYYSKKLGTIYLIKGDMMTVFQKNGRNAMTEKYDSDNHFIFDNDKMGWFRNGKIIIDPIYDEVEEWGFLVYETHKGNETKYFSEDGKEVLTFRRQIDTFYDSPFWQRCNDSEVFTILECPPLKDLPESNVLTLKDGKKIGIDRFNRDVILKELVNPDDDLPLTRKKIEGLTNKFSYEFSAYRFTVTGDKPIKKLIDLIKDFDVNDNSWYYIIRLTTPTGEYIPADELVRLTDFLDSNEETTLGRAIGIGHDDNLASGEVSMLIITHYNEACFPPEEQFEWVDVCKNGTMEEVKKAYNKLVAFIETEILDDIKGDFLIDSYDAPVYNISYNPNRSWEETKKVLDFLLTKSRLYLTRVWEMLDRIVKVKNSEESDFYIKYLEWILANGADANVVKNHQTPLDYVYQIMKDDGRRLETTMLKLRNTLIRYGGWTYEKYRAVYLQNHSEYEFALKVSAQ